MSEELRRTAHLLALARLQPGWDHECRGHLSAIKMHIELMVVLFANGSTEADSLRGALDRAMNASRKFETAMNDRAEALRGPKISSDLLDLAGHVARLGGVLAVSASDRNVRCSVESLSGPLWIEGGEPALREALNIAAAEMLFLCQPEDALTMRLESTGDRVSLRIEAPRMPSEGAPWLTVVRETFVKFGGEVKASAALELDLVVPRAAVPR